MDTEQLERRKNLISEPDDGRLVGTFIANETVAQHFYRLDIPFLYRTHERPDRDQIMRLAAFIRNFGCHIKLTGEEVHPKELQKLLDRIADTDEEAERETVKLKKAQYMEEHIGEIYEGV